VIHIACGCNRGSKVAANGVSGTYRVMVSGRQVYESSSKEAADAVAGRFETAVILAPGEAG
jgi:hypothetical protein